MSDQGRWFKLWTSVIDDPSLSDLSLEDFGRWCLFGAFLKEHGTNGQITLKAPGTALVRLFRLAFDAAIDTLRKFPNCTVTPVTNASVTYNVRWDNWQKYQGDSSTERTRQWRARQHESVTVKKRREESKQKPKNPLPLPRENKQGRESSYQIPEKIMQALSTCQRLGAAVGLRRPEFWQAQIAAFDIDFVAQIHKAESHLASNTRRHYTDLPRFLNNWFKRAEEWDA